VQELHGVVESVVFQLPKNLTSAPKITWFWNLKSQFQP
jgi:hypothetical protein